MPTSEVYLSQLDAEIVEKERRLERLRSWCDEETKKMNAIRQEKKETEENYMEFSRNLRRGFEEQMAKSARETEDFLEKCKINVTDLLRREEEVKKEKEILEKEKNELEQKRVQVESLQTTLSEEIAAVAKELDAALSLKATAAWDKNAVLNMRIKYAALSKKLKKSIEDWMTFESEKRKVLEEKESHLVRELAITLAERKAYFDSLALIEEEKKKIAGQWEQLLLAKQYLDGKFSKG